MFFLDRLFFFGIFVNIIELCLDLGYLKISLSESDEKYGKILVRMLIAWQQKIQCMDGATTHLKGVRVAAYHRMVFACFSDMGPFDLGPIPSLPPLSR